jgi:chromosomal replication initiator protein
MNDQLTFDDDDVMITLQRSWDSSIKRLRPEIPAAWYERFLRPLRPLSIENGVIQIAVPGRFVQEWVKERYLSTIQTLMSDEMGQPVVLELRTEARERSTTKAVDPLPAAPATPTVDSNAFRPIEKYSFEAFVVGQSNRLAYAGAKAVATNPGQQYNPLFIYGASGLGKTHLLHSIANELRKLQPGTQLVYMTAQQFAEEFVQAVHSNRIDQFRRAQRNVGIWLVDDIQFLANKDRTQEELFHTFNYLQSLGKQIVLTSDRPPRDIYFVDERLRSRFEAGLVADVQMPDTETRCAILLSKAKQEKIELDIELAMFLAENVPGNIRVLEGALTRLVALSSVEGVPMALDIATRMVDQYFRTGALARPSFESIVEAVSNHFRVPTKEILGTSRRAPIVHARHVAIYVTRAIHGSTSVRCLATATIPR